MSYYPHPHGYGSPPQGHNDDERITPPDLPSPPPVQVGSVPRTSRSVSSTRTTAPGQAQPIASYGVGRNWEPDPRHVPSTPAQPYLRPYGEHGGSSIQGRPLAYPQSVEQHFEPPAHPPPHASQHHRTSYSMPQQLSVPHNEPYPVHSQNAQYPQSSPESGEQSWRMQQPSPQYLQQQTWRSAAAYSPPQQPSPPQYSHQIQPFSNQPPSHQTQPLSNQPHLHQIQPLSNQPHSHQIQPISNHPQQLQPPSQYPGSGTWSSIASESLPIDNPGPGYQAGSPPSAPVGELLRCSRCGRTYPARGRSGNRYDVEQHDMEPGNPVTYGSLPPCPLCGYPPAR